MANRKKVMIMLMRMEIFSSEVVVETYEIPDSSWIQSRLMGAQYVYPVLKKTITYRNTSGYVICSPVKSVPDIPETLLKLVNSNDRRYGKNGYEWMGSHRDQQGGTEIDRVREYVTKAIYYKDNPLNIDEDRLRELQSRL